ncbi:MAG: hypothetical protein F4100_02585 [Rhodothermaceae bacterium]|nr:hypothetical protein [Rhodothermaceae bacterium]MYE63679.1 hypothetical protein [Rhodothermaceae bacterium]MYJ19621.1 hypothetical protein [Rhodothermaceae bacterium]
MHIRDGQFSRLVEIHEAIREDVNSIKKAAETLADVAYAMAEHYHIRLPSQDDEDADAALQGEV